MAEPIAVVREVAATFVDCVSSTPPVPPLDVDLARAQHAGYVAMLEASGFSVVVVPADDAHPDCCFIEDTAVVIDGEALVTRPGHPSRQGETGPVAAALAELVPIEHMQAPAQLDGGDVLQVGRSVFVGVGDRTSMDGVQALERFASRHGRRVVAVEPRGVLHLKSAVTALDDATVLAHESVIDPAAFEGIRVIQIGGDDPEAANVVRLADGSILVAEHHAPTAELVEGLGNQVVTTPVGEFARADGGLTCLSVRIRAES